MANAGSQLWPGGSSERLNVSNFSSTPKFIPCWEFFTATVGARHSHEVVILSKHPFSPVAQCFSAEHPERAWKDGGSPADQIYSPNSLNVFTSNTPLPSRDQNALQQCYLLCPAPVGIWGSGRRGLGAMLHGAAPWHPSSLLTPALSRQTLGVITFE